MATAVAPATNPSTRFAPFSITLANGATTTGISHIPPQSSLSPSTRPLIIGIHGGTCTAHHFDVNSSYTASLASSALGVPFVAFNRPFYLDSTPMPIPADTSFHRETGNWEHEFIFPMIWEKFGKPNGCTGIVLVCHSMAVPGAIVAASLWTKDSSPKYPLAGLIFSGWGTGLVEHESMGPPPITTESTVQLTPFKKLMMLGEDEHNAFSPDLIPLLDAQDVPMPVPELVDGRTMWFNYGPGYAKDINVPIMYAMGEHDWLWKGSKKYIREFEEWFPQCPRFDGSTVLGAPHALEWGRVSQGWYARFFGWAMEVCAVGRRS